MNVAVIFPCMITFHLKNTTYAPITCGDETLLN